MRTKYFILTLLFVQIVLSCNSQQKKVVVVEDVTYEKDEHEVEPPPPSFSLANPLTLKECFFKMCNTEKPKKDSTVYKFLLFETEKCYAIGLYPSAEDSTKKDSAPFEKFYSLSKSDYKNLAWKEVLNKIKSQLKDFTKTKEFENSSLSKAKKITLLFDDEDLISLK